MAAVSSSQGFFDPRDLPPGRERFRHYAKWRRRSSLAPGVEVFPGAGTTWYLFDHATVLEAMRHPDLLQAPEGAYRDLRAAASADPVFEFFTRSMLLSDPPEHGLLRKPLNRYFGRNRVASLEPVLMERARQLLAVIPQGQPVDLVQAFIVPFVVNTLAIMLGVRIDDAATLKRETAALAATMDLPTRTSDPQARASLMALRTRVESLLEDPERLNPEGLVAEMLALRGMGEWTHEQVVASTMFFLFAGQETVIDAIGNAVLALSEHPGEEQRLRQGRVDSRKASEELLRYGAPLHVSFARIAARPIVLGGMELAAMTPVMGIFASANRDPSVFDDPEQLCLDRHIPPGVMTFGAGTHICLGQHMARMEMNIALQALYGGDWHWEVHRGAVRMRPEIAL